MPVTTQPISLFQQTATEFGVILVGVTAVCWAPCATSAGPGWTGRRSARSTAATS